MRITAFFSRFALICNIAFILCLLFQRVDTVIPSNDINNGIVVLGWIVAPIANIIVCLLYLVRLLTKKPLGVRIWLALTNFLFLITQIFVQIILV
jgi:hypothetical protein